MTRVIKIGGRPQLDPSLPPAVAGAHRAAPGSLVVVHGGGDEVSTLQRLYGVEARFAGGRRVTSALDLEIIRMALSGSANKRLVSALVDAGVSAIGLSGEDGALLTADPLDPTQYGHVGTPAKVNTVLLRQLLSAGHLPVLSPMSRSTDPAMGMTLNVNGDDAAAAIAAALGADELVLIADIPAVLDPSGRRVPSLDLASLAAIVGDGVARGGMIAKLDAARRAVVGGVSRVRIGDLSAIDDRSAGTLVSFSPSTVAV